MFIRNMTNANGYYKCGRVMGRYLIKSGIPLLSVVDGKMVFVKTKRLQRAINNAPLYLRFLVKVGVVDG